MSRKDPYLYDDVDVLKNKGNIKDASQLDKFEEAIIPGRALILRTQPFTINSVFNIQQIHEYLFEPIFDWAGEFRKITMYKGEPILEGSSIDYTPADYIESEMNELDKEFSEVDWNKLDNEEKINKVAYFVAEVWHVHCFREGNTRSISMFMYCLMKTIGLHVNTEFIGKHSKYFRNSLVLASLYGRSRPEYLIGIIRDTTSIKMPDESKYKSIQGFDVEKYNYSYHTIEKLKTIKSLQQLEKEEQNIKK